MDTNMYIKKLTADKTHESKNILIKDDNGVQYNCYIERPYNTLFKKYKSYDGNTFIENNDDTDEKQVFTLCNKDITPDEALEKVKKLIPNFTSNKNYKIIDINDLKNYAKNAYIQSFYRVIGDPYDSESKLNEYLLEYFNQIIDDIMNPYEDDNAPDIKSTLDNNLRTLFTNLDLENAYTSIEQLCKEVKCDINEIFNKAHDSIKRLPNDTLENTLRGEQNKILLLFNIYKLILNRTDINKYINKQNINIYINDVIDKKNYPNDINTIYKNFVYILDKDNNIQINNIHDIIQIFEFNVEDIKTLSKIDNNYFTSYLNDRNIQTLQDLLLYFGSNIFIVLVNLVDKTDNTDKILSTNAYVKFVKKLNTSLKENKPESSIYYKRIKNHDITKLFASPNYADEIKYNNMLLKSMEHHDIVTLENLDNISWINIWRILNSIIIPSGGSSNRLFKLYISTKNDYYLL